MPAHEKESSAPEADVKRENVEKLQQVPEASMILSSMSKPLPPSVAAEIPQQTAMSKEAAERVLSHWAERDEAGAKKEQNKKDDLIDMEHEHEEGLDKDFKADSLLSAADYLAPDYSRKNDNSGDGGHD